MAPKLRIMVVDDHDAMRGALITLINNEADMIVVAEAECGRSAVQRVADSQPDVIVMDIIMPNLNGIKATTQIKLAHPSVQVVLLSGLYDYEEMSHLVAAGASGYIHKLDATDVLLDVIRIVARGDTYFGLMENQSNVASGRPPCRSGP